MEVLWDEGPVPARRVVEVLSQRIGWNKNTTYTVIKKCVEKGVVRREEIPNGPQADGQVVVRRDEPDFLCTPLVERAAVQREETNALIERMFGGSSELFFSSFLRERGIGEEDTRELLRLIQEKGGEKR